MSDKCPICFSELSKWSDDPIRTTPSLHSDIEDGFTPIKATHIIELQNDRNIKELELGLSPTDWTTINYSSLYPITSQHIQELRESTERILDAGGFNLWDYFNKDEEGNLIPEATGQSNWHDSTLTTGKTQIKAIHIEDLRHAIPMEVETGVTVHCHNPEGKEINSIEGVSDTAVSIYKVVDGVETLLGYGAHNEDTHPKIFTLDAGEYTIRVKFNGMEIDKEVTLESLEDAEVLIFEFTRTSFESDFSPFTFVPEGTTEYYTVYNQDWYRGEGILAPSIEIATFNNYFFQAMSFSVVHFYENEWKNNGERVTSLENYYYYDGVPFIRKIPENLGNSDNWAYCDGWSFMYRADGGLNGLKCSSVPFDLDGQAI